MSYEPCYIGAFVGDKGSGKSLSLCECIVHELAEDKKVWSNMPVKLSPAILNRGYSRYGNRLKYKEVEPLDYNLALMLDESIVEGTIAIDELTYDASNRDFMSTKNKILGAMTRQVRHRSLNLIYTAKSIWWIDNHIRDETDFVVTCRDLAYSPWGRSNHVPGGTVILREWYDYSGMMTGTSVHKTGWVPYWRERYYGTPYWDCYDTGDIISLEEIFTKTKLDLKQRVISNKEDDSSGYNNAFMRAYANFKGENKTEIPAREFWEYLYTVEGISGNPSQLGRYIPKELMRRKQKTGGEWVYQII